LLARIADGVRSYASVAPFLWRIGVRDAATIRSARNSLDVLLDVAFARADLRILKNAAAGFDPHVVFLQTLLYPCYLAYFLPEGYPIVVTFWNGDVTFWSQWDGIDRVIKRQIVSHGVRRASALTVNSEHARRCLMEIGAEADKIHMIRYPGVDLERFAPGSKPEARRALGISAEKVVLCPRGIGGFRNSDVIVEAAAKVARTNPGTLFLFVSVSKNDAEWERHLEKAGAMGIADCLRLDGHVPWETMPLYDRAADVVVSISSEDSLPNCMLEAMACEVPLIMGDIPQLRDWMEDGVNGFLVPCRDPDALAEKISRILGAAPEEIGKWTGRAATLVREKCDGKTAGREIRNLVKDVARRRHGA
ncbi:MAG: glycosyltransferase family 4 protein, partial [Deltaproteobacteria bacterium]|nr:glycosyltransferase family 4 protein [Deltaproteobacteria bacterium]